MARKLFLLCVLPCLALFILAGGIFPEPTAARSAFSPRHSGLEPPGGPRPLEGMPGRSPGRTPDGGMGYADAYGNPVGQGEIEAKKTPARLRPGAYGAFKPDRQESRLPDPQKPASPLWKF